MNAAIILADISNIGLLACAVIDTAATISYAITARGKWRHSPFGLHLMCFMAAFAVVLDQSAIYLITGPGVLVTHAPPGPLDWFAWLRAVSFDALIPPVLAWRLIIILRPPSRR